MPDPLHWAAYNEKQVGRQVRPLLTTVLAHIGPGTERVAIDVGCGAGIETRRDAASRLITRVVDLNELPALPVADLVFSGYALPFVHPARFHDMWSTVIGALAPGGVIAVNLFGDRDSWADRKDETYLTEAEVRSLCEGLQLLHFRVKEEDGPAFTGPKHWHLVDLIARRARVGDASGHTDDHWSPGRPISADSRHNW